MAEYGINNAYHIHQIIDPSGETTTNDSDIICMKGYNHADCLINVGAAGTNATATQAVTFDKMDAVGSAGTTALAFTDYYVTGAKVYVTNWNGTAWTDDEQVTGNTFSASLEEFVGDYITCFDVTVGLVAAETLTGGTSGATVTAVNANEYEDAIVKRAAGSNTFAISGTDNIAYVVPIPAVLLLPDYNCWELNLAAPTSGTFEESATAILYRSRYMAGDTQVSAIYD